MSTLVIIPTTLITLALIFYSLGVWAERIARYLKLWHVVAFWIGFTFDISGTYAMHLLAKGLFDITEPHTLTGQITLWLMLSFHKFSIVVWVIWLIPYFGGMFLGMSG